MITQFISPWTDGSRTTLQFFPHLNQMWIITCNNCGKVENRSEHDLGKNYQGVFEAAVQLGWERMDSEVAS